MTTESRSQAEERGFNPSDYLFSPLPEGEWEGVLDAKIWGKSSNLNCYFTADDGRKYVLCAFSSRDSRYMYGPSDYGINFKLEPNGRRYCLITGVNSRGKPKWNSAKIIE